MLKPAGRWIVQVPNGESPFFGRVRRGDLTHRRAWRLVRLAYRFCIAAETGETGRAIVLSQNLLAVFEK